MKKLLPFLLLILLTTNLVAGLTLECPQRANVDNGYLVCTLNSSQREKVAVYVSSVNEVKHEPGDVVLYVETNGESRFSWLDKPFWFTPPAMLNLSLSDALSRITYEYEGPFTGDLEWMFYGKENVFTFTVVHQDGRNESREVRVFIGGRANLGRVILEYIKLVSILTLIFIAILGAVGGVIYGIKRALTSSSNGGLKLFLIVITLGILEFVVIQSYDLISGLLFYFLGSAEHFRGDMAVGWGLSAVIAMFILYLSGVHSYSVQNVAYKKPLQELKKLNLTFCSGLAWFPWTLLLYPPGIISEDVWAWMMVILIFAIEYLTPWIVEALGVEGVFALNILLALFVGHLFKPDSSVLIALILALGILYLTQRRCIRKFTEEKERWVKEIEKRIAKLEGNKNRSVVIE